MGSAVSDAVNGVKSGGALSILSPGLTGLGGILSGPGQRAAALQGQMAEAQLAEQQNQRAQATSAAAPSLAELQQLSNSVQLNQTDIERKQKLLASADPALMEAGQQALKLLQGGEAANLDPLKRQRAEGRTQLEAQLRQQLGSGYATSSAGIEALRKYDESTSNSLQTAQSQSLATLLGSAYQTESVGNLQNNIANSSALSGQYGAQSSRMVSAINATPITAAGAQYAGDLFSNQADAQTRNTLLNLGVQAGTAVATGGMSAAGGAKGASAGGGGGGYFSRQA